jgi:hypothetical protein
MNFSLLISPPIVFVIPFAIVVVGSIIFYALRCKGDVRAEFSHGSTMFKLEAKAKKNGRKK